MRFVDRFVVLLGAVLLTGCASAPAGSTSETTAETGLSRLGGAVQVTESATRARECQFIADVPVASSDPTNAASMIALRNDAGAAGANLVLLVMASRTTIERAEGYLCAD
jgi:hypothetical protein